MEKRLFNAQIWLNVGNFNEHVYLVPADAVSLLQEDYWHEDTPTYWLLPPSWSARISDH